MIVYTREATQEELVQDRQIISERCALVKASEAFTTLFHVNRKASEEHTAVKLQQHPVIKPVLPRFDEYQSKSGGYRG
jgi:hypothetical protein